MRRAAGSASVAAMIVLGFVAMAMGAVGDTERVSVSSTGAEGNRHSRTPSVSDDGRFVAFDSEAINLVPGDTNARVDTFVRDRSTGETTRVSISSGGGQSNESSTGPAISGDGRYVAFGSFASNLVSGDENENHDVFVHDRSAGTTERVSVATGGGEGDGGSSSFPAISSDGRFVAFHSFANTLVPDDANGRADVFVRDRQTETTSRVSVVTGGGSANDSSVFPSISADGRFVAFFSLATNLVGGDTNDRADIFVHDRRTGETTRVSVSSDGAEADGPSSSHVDISADGRYVAFTSSATNLVAGDTNDHSDVFVHDRESGVTERVSVGRTASGFIVQGNGQALDPVISDDGRYVVFNSSSSNLLSGRRGDSNNAWDVFVHDRDTNDNTRVSVSTEGSQGNGESGRPAVSADGRFVAFYSEATNLVPFDGNNVADVFVHQFLSDPAATTTTTTTTTPTTPTTPTTTTVPDSAGRDWFVDDDGHLFEGDIDRFADAGVTRGCNPPINDRFCPDDSVTRGQMAAFLVRALGYVDDGGGDLFSDDDGSVFEGDIDRLGTAGVTRGCNPPINDRFCPDDSVTRGQMAAFLVRALLK